MLAYYKVYLKKKQKNDFCKECELLGCDFFCHK